MGQSRYQHKKEVVKCQEEMEQDHPVKDRAQVEVWEWAAEPIEAEWAARVPEQDREEAAFAQAVEQRCPTRQEPLVIIKVAPSVEQRWLEGKISDA